MTTESEAALGNLVDSIRLIGRTQQTVLWEIARLREIEAWAKRQQPIQVGDKVVIADGFAPIQHSSGWWGERDCLIPGATGVVESLEFNGYADEWTAGFKPDVQWSIATWGDPPMVWPAKETNVFAFRVVSLRLRTDDDKGLTMHDVVGPTKDSLVCGYCGKPISLYGGIWKHVH